jgi:OFA family oxalate/formate antiporter-like MFS transporter
VFGMAITFDILTAVLAIAVLKPMRRRFLLAQRGA